MPEDVGAPERDDFTDLVIQVQTLVDQGLGADVMEALRRIRGKNVCDDREIVNGDYKYWAFISYSHKDADWGDWVHRTLENYRVPANLVGRETSSGVIPKRVFPIFRDREELGAASELTDEITAALEASRFLVVICSVASAKSHWVGEEIKCFKSMYGSQRVLCIIVDGEPNAWDGSDECIPEAVRYQVTTNRELTNRACEPIAADARPQGDGRFNAKLKLLAGLLGVRYDELRQREKVRRRRMQVTWSLASLLIVLLVASGFYLRQNSIRATALVESIAGADVNQVVEIAGEMARYRWWSEPLLRDQFEKAKQGTDEKLKLRIALSQFDSEQAGLLLEDLLGTNRHANVGEIIQALGNIDAPVEDDCWRMLRTQGPARRRFNAGIVLASLDANSDRWTKADFELLVDGLVAINTVYQPEYWPLLKGVGQHILDPLEAVFRDSLRPESEQLAAANAIVVFAEQDEDRLTKLMLVATGPQYNILYETYRDFADARTNGDLATSIQVRPTDDLSAETRIKLGKERAYSAITLLRQGERESILGVLRYKNDPEALTQFVHGCRVRGVTPVELIELLDIVDQQRGPLDGGRQKIDDSVMYALLLALGDYAWDDLPPTRETLVERLKAIYEKDPSSGVHSASGWLLRQWGQHNIVDRIDRTPREYDPSGHYEWFVREIAYEIGDTGGLFAQSRTVYFTFIVFHPDEFTMGSPQQEPYHQFDEIQRRVELPRPIAVCDRELTWAQWEAFEGSARRQDYVVKDSMTLLDNDPVYAVTWFDAVVYCRWLNEQVGDAQRYDDSSLQPKNRDGSPPGLAANGFRLPTEEEWEFVCRSHTVTAFSFGHDEQLLNHYAWFVKNSDDSLHHTASLRPNPRGLFDIHGNVNEWCHDWYSESGLRNSTDPTGADESRSRVYRGGSWGGSPRTCRSADRSRGDPTETFGYLGFRLATVPEGQGSEVEELESVDVNSGR